MTKSLEAHLELHVDIRLEGLMALPVRQTCSGVHREQPRIEIVAQVKGVLAAQIGPRELSGSGAVICYA